MHFLFSHEKVASSSQRRGFFRPMVALSRVKKLNSENGDYRAEHRSKGYGWDRNRTKV